jgi:hypothetical protein
MADVSEPDFRYLDMREKLAHIDQMLADNDRKRQEIRLAPWQIAFAGMTAGAALFASGAAVGGLLTKVLFP